MFPNNWNQQRVLDEIALKNKIQRINPNKSYIFRGQTSNGINVEFIIRNNEIKTVYPVIDYKLC